MSHVVHWHSLYAWNKSGHYVHKNFKNVMAYQKPPGLHTRQDAKASLKKNKKK